VPRRVAITGAAGQLGRQLVRAFTEAGDEVLPLSRPDFDVTDSAHLARLTAWSPDVVVNSAAWTDVDGCARDPERAMRINGEGAGAVARAAAEAGALIVQISTNEIFDGTLDRPYVEDDEPNPINPYGASKLAGEHAVARANPGHLIVRTAWLFGPGGTNFVTKILAAADRASAASAPLRVVSDEWGNPTWVPTLADAASACVQQGVSGVLHLAGQPATTRFEWARLALKARPVRLRPMESREYVRPSLAPKRAVLSTSLADSYGIPRIFWRQPTLEMASAAAAAVDSAAERPR